MPTISNAAGAVLAVGLLAATAIDLRTRRIPNLLTGLMATAGVGLAAAGATGITPAGAAIGAVLGLALMLPGHFFGGTGAGDVKLMGAVGALVGPGLVIRAFLFSSIAGGVLAVIVAVRRRRLHDTLRGTARIAAAPVQGRRESRGAGAARRFAYGPAIAVGSLLATIAR